MGQIAGTYAVDYLTERQSALYCYCNWCGRLVRLGDLTIHTINNVSLWTCKNCCSNVDRERIKHVLEGK